MDSFGFRHRRSLDDDDQEDDQDFPYSVIEQIPPETVHLIRLHKQLSSLSGEHQRQKRETADQVSEVINEIQRNLETLEENFHKERNLTKDSNSPAKCFVGTDGKVNCTDIIYEDEKSWKRSRHQIDLLIKVLKKKITDLKDIKKHLKEHKPVNVKDDDDLSVWSKEEEESSIAPARDDGLGPLIDLTWYTSTESPNTTSTTEEEVKREFSTPNPNFYLKVNQTIRRKVPKRPLSNATFSTGPNQGRLPKRPLKTTTTSTPVTKKETTTTLDTTKIPIFYIGEDKVASEIYSPTVTDAQPSLAVVPISTTTSFESLFSTTISNDLETPTLFNPSSTQRTTHHHHKPHRHNHGFRPSNGSTDLFDGQRRQHSEDNTTPAECYCDFDGEK